MGCGQSVATHGNQIYEMTFDMTNSSSPPIGGEVQQGFQGLGLVEDDQSLLRMVDGLPGVSQEPGSDELRMPGRLIRVTPLQQRVAPS